MKMKLSAVIAAILAVPARMRALFATLLALVAGGLASAQTATDSAPLDLSAQITGFGTTMRGVITTNSPALFGVLALAVGFYFLWGRVRALF